MTSTQTLAAATKPQPQRRFLGIQALRAVAASMVLVTHSTYYAFERLDGAFSTWEKGTRGVDLFFVISGFVMIYSSRSLRGTRTGWWQFALHRIVRIVPLYWLVTTMKILIMLVSTGLALHAMLNINTAVCSYLFLPARNLDGKIEPLVAVGWTLNFEMLFYLIFTLALLAGNDVLKSVGAALTLLAAGGIVRQPSWPAASVYFNSIVLEFFFGMVVASLCIRQLVIPRAATAWLLVVGFVCLLSPPFDSPLPKALISGLPAFFMIWAAASLGSLERHIPRFVLYLGDASYSIYLIHPFVCPLPPALMHKAHVDLPWLSVCCSVALGIGAGCLLHRFVEAPLTARLTTNLKGRQARKTVVAVAGAS